jgi:hypothetical protein
VNLSNLQALIAEAEADDAAATKGPWCYSEDGKFGALGPCSIWPEGQEGYCCIAKTASINSNGRGRKAGDAAFIAHARTREPRLARALKAALVVVCAARSVKLDYELIHDAAGVPVDRVPCGPPTVEAVAALESACCAFEKELTDA